MQRTGYLLQTIRHEPELAYQHTYIQTAASRGAIIFDAACDDLIVRDDTLLADLDDGNHRGAGNGHAADGGLEDILMNEAGKRNACVEEDKGCRPVAKRSSR